MNKSDCHFSLFPKTQAYCQNSNYGKVSLTPSAFTVQPFFGDRNNTYQFSYGFETRQLQFSFNIPFK